MIDADFIDFLIGKQGQKIAVRTDGSKMWSIPASEQDPMTKLWPFEKKAKSYSTFPIDYSVATDKFHLPGYQFVSALIAETVDTNDVYMYLTGVVWDDITYEMASDLLEDPENISDSPETFKVYGVEYLNLEDYHHEYLYQMDDGLTYYLNSYYGHNLMMTHYLADWLPSALKKSKAKIFKWSTKKQEWLQQVSAVRKEKAINALKKEMFTHNIIVRNNGEFMRILTDAGMTQLEYQTAFDYNIYWQSFDAASLHPTSQVNYEILKQCVRIVHPETSHAHLGFWMKPAITMLNKVSMYAPAKKVTKTLQERGWFVLYVPDAGIREDYFNLVEDFDDFINSLTPSS